MKTEMVVAFMVLLVVHIVASSVPREENVKKDFTWDDLSRIAKSGVRSAMKMVMPSMFRAISAANVSGDCERGLISYVTAIRKLDSWAVKMIDASSKIPSGILEGTMMDFGSFDECLDIRVNEKWRSSNNKELFRGRYCTLKFRSPLLSVPWEKLSDGRNYTDVYGHPPEFVNETIVKVAAYIDTISAFWMGICIPSVCTERDLLSISTVIAEPFGVEVMVKDCQVDEPYVWKLPTLAAVCSLGCLGMLCSAGTLLDVLERWRKSSTGIKHVDRTFTRAMKAFSVLGNTEKLFSEEVRSECLDCFNGIRFLTATWIILGHTYIHPELLKYAEYRGMIRTADQQMGNILFTVIENYILCVSTFFFMSGFLLVYTTWKQLKENNGRINLFMFFVHKYWRMAPGLLLVIALLFFMPFIDSGPLWNIVLEPQLERCQKFWWRNLLFIHNWYEVEDLCLDHTWYLAALMQLHVVGILLLVLTYRWPAIGIFMSLLTMAGCMTSVAIYVVLRNYSMPVVIYVDKYDHYVELGETLYVKPFYHFPCYLVGMIGAFVILKYRSTKLAVKYQTSGWIIAIIFALYSVYGVHFNADHVASKVMYHSTARIWWALSLAWMTYACASGFGGIVNRVLTFPAMRPLGHISFLTYLIHYVFIIYNIASARERIYGRHSVLVISALSTMVVGFALAYIGYVTVEMPFATLEKIIFRSPVAKNNKKKDADECQTTATPNGTVTSL